MGPWFPAPCPRAPAALRVWVLAGGMGGQPKPHSGRPRVGPARAESAPGDDLVPQRTTPSKTLCLLPAGKGSDGQPGRRRLDQGLAESKPVSRGRGRKLAAEREAPEEAEAGGLSCCHLLLPEKKQMWNLPLAPDPEPRGRESSQAWRLHHRPGLCPGKRLVLLETTNLGQRPGGAHL